MLMENSYHSGQTGEKTQKKSLNSQKKKQRYTKNTSKSPLNTAPKRSIVFTYTSACCSVPAKKPPCVKPVGDTKELMSLGKWRCSSCGKRCKVTRSKNE